MAQSNIDQLFEDYFKEWMWFYPLEATMGGITEYNDTFPNDISVAYIQKLETFYKKYDAMLDEYNVDQLTVDQKMSYDILKYEFKMKLEELEYKLFRYMPIDQFWSKNIQIAQMASGSSIQPFKTIDDYEKWLVRLNDFLIWCDTAMINMQKGIELGYVLPKPLIEKTIPQWASFMNGPAEKHLFYMPIKNMPDTFPEKEKIRLAEAYTVMIDQNVVPTYKKVHNFLQETYLPAGRKTSGYVDLPGGKEAYNWMIKYYTSTNLTADEIFELGKSEVERLSTEMRKVKNELGFEGDLHAFFDHLRSLDQLIPFTEPEQVIARFNSIHEKMKPRLAQLFDLVPKTAFEVRRTEAFREASSSAQYNPGSLDGSRPGVFYVPIPDVTKYNILSDEDLFLHEAIPGHHYQISLQQEKEEMPGFRKLLWMTAYGEGWALYSESLGKELGLYTDPYQYFGMLSAEMHRAIRLVVDVGLHAKGWTREEAIEYSMEHEAEPYEGIVSEIERYMAKPGQALSYKIGQLKILELRKKAEKELGSQFDIKQFHNQVLDAGCLPLVLLEEKINKWITETKGI